VQRAPFLLSPTVIPFFQDANLEACVREKKANEWCTYEDYDTAFITCFLPRTHMHMQTSLPRLHATFVYYKSIPSPHIHAKLLFTFQHTLYNMARTKQAARRRSTALSGITSSRTRVTTRATAPKPILVDDSDDEAAEKPPPKKRARSVTRGTEKTYTNIAQV
jgi:hypothetical protein